VGKCVGVDLDDGELCERVAAASVLVISFLAAGHFGSINGAWAKSGFNLVDGATGLAMGAAMLLLLGLVAQAIGSIIRGMRGIS
jgi:hypothetical protein